MIESSWNRDPLRQARQLRGPLRQSTTQPCPSLEECYFYHFFDLLDGRVVGGPAAAFNLRGQFSEYIGNVDLKDQSVFDFGTASGFLAFGAEQAGAAEVTAFDTLSFYYQQRIPFKNYLFVDDKIAWAESLDPGFKQMHNSFWYMWHHLKSNVRMVYGFDEDLICTTDKFDVVIAGAVMEHLSDPVTALGALSRLTKKTLILAFTPVFLHDEEYMKPLVPWDNVDRSYVWWGLSKGLYITVLNNLGFEVEFINVSAVIVENGVRNSIPRQTIIATRRG